MLVNAKVVEIRDRSIIVEQNGESREIGDIDSVALAMGVKPDHAIEQDLKEAGCRYHLVGDATGGRKALDTILGRGSRRQRIS